MPDEPQAGNTEREEIMAKESLGERIWYKYWPSQVPKCLDYPDCTLAEFLRQSAAKHGPQAAIYFLDARVTYSELWDMVQRLARALADIGLKKGDVCALMLPNSIQFVASYYACQLIGLTVTEINPTYKALEMQYQLKDSGAKVLVVLDAVAQEVPEAIQGTQVGTVIGTNVVDLCGFSPIKVLLGKVLKKIPTGELPPGALHLKNLLKAKPNPPKEEVDPSEEIVRV